ncbi:hypothetical protein L9G15_03645 [Shewanella sp. A3A]|nr:hypothetical protein [Shewanella ferrihydritica]
MMKGHVVDNSYQIALPLRLLQQRFGDEQWDEAADTIIEQLNIIRPDKSIAVAFDFDTSHSNPWFHSMMVTISAATTVELAQLTTWLHQQALLEP